MRALTLWGPINDPIYCFFCGWSHGPQRVTQIFVLIFVRRQNYARACSIWLLKTPTKCISSCDLNLSIQTAYSVNPCTPSCLFYIFPESLKLERNLSSCGYISDIQDIKRFSQLHVERPGASLNCAAHEWQLIPNTNPSWAVEKHASCPWLLTGFSRTTSGLLFAVSLELVIGQKH